MEIRERPEQPPKQHKAAFCGEAAQSHQSRPDQLETSWDLASVNPEVCLKPFERFISFNHFPKPVVTQCSHCISIAFTWGGTAAPPECWGTGKALGGHSGCENEEAAPCGWDFPTLRPPPLLLCKTQEVDSEEGRFPSGLSKKTGKESRIQDFFSSTEWEVFRAAPGWGKLRWRLCPHGTGQQTTPSTFHKVHYLFQNVLFSVLLYS